MGAREVLSQEEIDALLHGVDSGKVDTGSAATPGEDKPKGPTLPITASSMQELCDNVRAVSWELHRIADIMGSMSQIMAVRAVAVPARRRGAGEGDDDDE